MVQRRLAGFIMNVIAVLILFRLPSNFCGHSCSWKCCWSRCNIYAFQHQFTLVFALHVPEAHITKSLVIYACRHKTVCVLWNEICRFLKQCLANKTVTMSDYTIALLCNACMYSIHFKLTLFFLLVY